MSARMYVFMHACMYLCMHVFMCTCIHVCIYVCIPNSVIHNRCSGNTNPFYTPFARTNTRLTSIKCAGPRTWNIRSLPSLQLFQWKLSAYILSTRSVKPPYSQSYTNMGVCTCYVHLLCALIIYLFVLVQCMYLVFLPPFTFMYNIFYVS